MSLSQNIATLSGNLLTTLGGDFLVTIGDTAVSTLTSLSVTAAQAGATFTETFSGTNLTDASAVVTNGAGVSGTILSITGTSVTALITISPSAGQGGILLGLLIDGVTYSLPFTVLPPVPTTATVPGSLSRPGGRIILQPKLTDEQVTYEFPFERSLAPGEAISLAAMAAAVRSGTDPNPIAVVSGFQPTISGSSVWITLVGGLVGVQYDVTCVITTSFNQRLDMVGVLAIIGVTP